MESADVHAAVMLAVLAVHLIGVLIIAVSATALMPAFLAGILGVRALRKRDVATGREDEIKEYSNAR